MVMVEQSTGKHVMEQYITVTSPTIKKLIIMGAVEQSTGKEIMEH